MSSTVLARVGCRYPEKKSKSPRTLRDAGASPTREDSRDHLAAPRCAKASPTRLGGQRTSDAELGVQLCSHRCKGFFGPPRFLPVRGNSVCPFGTRRARAGCGPVLLLDLLFCYTATCTCTVGLPGISFTVKSPWIVFRCRNPFLGSCVWFVEKPPKIQRGIFLLLGTPQPPKGTKNGQAWTQKTREKGYV